MKIRLEGWRFVPHSYSLVFCAHAADLARRGGHDLTMADWPMHPDMRWDGAKALPLPEDSALINAIPLSSGEDVDALYRVSLPVDLDDENATRTLVHLTADNGTIADGMMTGRRPLVEWLQVSGAHIATPSAWSRDGLLRVGVEASRIHIVPHGVDARLFKPGTEEERSTARTKYNIRADAFIFLNVGSMARRKGIDLLVQAFKVIVRDFPQAVLVLKGTDGIFRSLSRAQGHIRKAKGGETRPTFEKNIAYIGETLSTYQLAQVYKMADCYVTPYRAEGFNLPAIEAIASGLPILCTKGGPTDDFGNAIGLGIKSTLSEDAEAPGGIALEPDLDELIRHMRLAIDNQEDWARNARMAGPEIATQWTWAKATDKLIEAMQP